MRPATVDILQAVFDVVLLTATVTDELLVTEVTADDEQTTTLFVLALKHFVYTIIIRDVTKFTFKFDNVRTSNVFSRFKIRRNFSRTRRRIRTSGLHDRHHMSTTPTGHQNNQLNKCAFPNSLKGPKIILDRADRHVSKDGPFRILGNALTYLL